MSIQEIIEKCRVEHKGAIIHNGELVGFIDENMEGEESND